MSVDEKTVRRIAHLARLKLADDEVAPLQTELNNILSWIEQLGEVATDGVDPMTTVIPNSLRWREDIANADPLTGGDRQQDVLRNAPQAEFGFFAVPKVIE